MNKFFVIVLCFALMSPVLQAEEVASKPYPSLKSEGTPLIPRKLLFGNPVKASPKLSPDGASLSYLAPDENNVLNVWIKDLIETKQEDKKITSDKKQGIRSFFWQFDHDHILYIQDKDGDENWHLYQTNIQNLETKDLTPFPHIQVDIVAYDEKWPDTMLISMNRRDPKAKDVYRLNLKTGSLELDTENPGDVFSWVADHQLNTRIATSYTKDGSTLIQIRNNAKEPWKQLLLFDPLEIGGNVIEFSPDGKSIFLITSVNTNSARLVSMDLETGELSTLVVDRQYDVSEVMVNPKSYRIEAVGFEKQFFEWVILDKSIEPDFTFLSKELKNSQFKIVSRDLSDTQWIIASFSDQHPTHYYSYLRKDKKLNFLFSTQPELEKYSLNPMTAISFVAKDGLRLHGYLSLPQHEQTKKLPTVIFVHGGPWARDVWGFNPTVQWLTNRGYAVLQVNFRGSTGYGKSYINAGNREWAGKMHQDLIDAKNWLVNQELSDPNKVAIFGGSYGGYATLVGLTFTPEEFCCGVDVVGPSNLITLLQTLPPYWTPLIAQMNRRLGSLETDQAFLEERSPYFKADAIRKPLLIAQGANDPRVKQAESDQIVKAMREKNIPVEYLLFTDEGHGFAKPQNRLKFYAAMETFLAKYLGGRVEKPSANEDWESLKK